MRDLQDFVRREICKISSDANLLPLPWACHRGMQVPCDLWPIHKIKCCLSDIVGVDVMPLAWCILPRGWLYVDDPSILFMWILIMHPAKDIFVVVLFVFVFNIDVQALQGCLVRDSQVRAYFAWRSLLSCPCSIWLWDRWVSPYLSKSKLSLLIIMISL